MRKHRATLDGGTRVQGTPLAWPLSMENKESVIPHVARSETAIALPKYAG